MKGRITPACAGKRAHNRKMAVLCGDHPRVCGEKRAALIESITRMGSPPRVRGKDTTGTRSPKRPGITPACAGKSVPFGDYIVPQ